jgi:hypothetical protein
LGAIVGASRIRWDLRPHRAFPTLAARVVDACPRHEDARSLAAPTHLSTRLAEPATAGAASDASMTGAATRLPYRLPFGARRCDDGAAPMGSSKRGAPCPP